MSPEVAAELMEVFNLIRMLVDAVKWVGVRAVFIVCIVALPITVILLVVSAVRLQSESNHKPI